MDRSSSRRLCFQFFACAAVLLSAVWAGAAPLIHVTPGFTVDGFLITPDGNRVVFGWFEGSSNTLYSARTDGVGAPIPISPLTAGSGSLFQAQISPDSAWVLYNRHEHPTERLHVATYSSRVDGSAPPTLLNISPIYDDDASQYNLAISTDSRHAIVRADRGDNSFDLLSRRIDGSSPSLPLNEPYHSDEGGGRGVSYFWNTAGNRVVFDDPNNAMGWGLYSRVFDGSAPAQKLTPDGLTPGIVAVSANGGKVAFSTYPGSGGDWDLYSNSTAGGPPTLLQTGEINQPTLRDVSINSTGTHAITINSDFRLATVPTDGSSAAKFFGPYADGTTIGYEISPDGAHIAHFSREGHHGPVGLFLSEIDGSGIPQRLTPAPPPGREVRFGNFAYFSSDSRYLVYTSDQLVAGRDDIFSVPLDGSSQPIRLSGPAAFVLTPDGQSIVAALNPDANQFFDSFVLIPLGGGESIPLAENPYATGGIPGWGSHWQLSGDGRLLVFLADNNAGTREIFAVAIPEPGGVLVFLFAGFVSMARSRRRINLQ